MTDDPTAGLLAPALERAIAVARAGEDETPPQPAPTALKRYLTFRNLPRRALQAVQRVVEEDEDFRSRVAEAASEDEVGPAAWLWLTRPEGWQGRLDELVHQVVAVAEEADAERSDHRLERRMAAAEEKADRARAQASEDRRLAEEARKDLGVERRRRRAIEQQVEGLEHRVDELRSELEREQRARTEAEGALAAREGEIVQAREQLRVLDDELEHRSRPSDPPGVDPARMRRVLDQAEGAVGALGDALEELSRSIPDTGSGAADPTPSAPDPRKPVALPPGLRADSPDAAEFLLRRPGAVVLVDGYNASMAAWPDEPIAEQRRRLVDALGTLAARTGVEPDVVFDGTDTGTSPVRSPGVPVRIRFTPAGTEADDLILDLIEAYPPGRPVVVVSSDRRVHDGAVTRGANAVRSQDLLEVLRVVREGR